MYIIDGHNLIGSGCVPGVSLEQEDDEWRLVRYVRARQPQLKQPVVIVFDGGIPGGAAPALAGGGVEVVFAARTEAGSGADALILARVRRQGPRRPLTVVTNDTALAAGVQALGGRTLTAGEFSSQLQAPARRPPSRRRRPQPEPKLPKAEVEAWLEEFKKRGE